MLQSVRVLKFHPYLFEEKKPIMFAITTLLPQIFSPKQAAPPLQTGLVLIDIIFMKSDNSSKIFISLDCYQRIINFHNIRSQKKEMKADTPNKDQFDVFALKKLVMKYPEQNFEKLKEQVGTLIDQRSKKLSDLLKGSQNSLQRLEHSLNDYGMTGKPDLMCFFKELKCLLDQNKLPSLFSEYCTELYPIFIKVASLSISQDLEQTYDLSFNGLEVLFQQYCNKYGVTEEQKQKMKSDTELIKKKADKSEEKVEVVYLDDLGYIQAMVEDWYSQPPNLQIGGGDTKLEKYEFMQQQENQADLLCTSWKKISDCLAERIPFPELKQYFIANDIENLGDLPIKLKEELGKILKINPQNLALNQDILIKSADLSWKFVNSLFSQTLYLRSDLERDLQQFRKECLNSKKGFPGILIGKLAPHPELLIYHKKKYDKVLTNLMLNFLKEPEQKSPHFQKFEEKLQYIKTAQNQEYYASSFHFSGQVHSFEELANQLPKLSLLISKLEVKLIVIGDFQFGVDKEKITQYYNPRFNRYYLKDKNSKIRYKNFQATFFKDPLFDKTKRGGFPYYCPGDWMRISLRVTENQKEFDQKYENWCIAYQGTQNQENLYSILTTGFRSAVGCYSKITPVSYFSPSIQYASKYFKPFFDETQKKWVTMVLQVRIDPKQISQRKGHTLPNIFKIEQHFKDKPNEYEWLVKGKTELKKGENGKKFGKGYEQNLFPHDGVVPYGIMIRYTDERPSYRYDQKK